MPILTVIMETKYCKGTQHYSPRKDDGGYNKQMDEFCKRIEFPLKMELQGLT